MKARWKVSVEAELRCEKKVVGGCLFKRRPTLPIVQSATEQFTQPKKNSQEVSNGTNSASNAVRTEFLFFSRQWNFLLLERALASSSGGAACPGGTRGQPREPQESGDDSNAF